MAIYRVGVKTGSVDYGGTDSNVRITIYGTLGNSDERHLINAGNPFEKGKTDNFIIESKELGELEKIRIWHDNSGDNPGWWLDWVNVYHEQTGKEWRFNLNGWLASDEPPYVIDRIIYLH